MSYKANKNEESALVSFFKNIKEETGVVHIFDKGDHFLVLGDDATVVAQIVFRTSSVIKQLGERGPACLRLSNTQLSVFLKDALLNRGFRIFIYGFGAQRWKLAKSATPGNIQEVEEMIGGQIDSSPVSIAVHVVQKTDQRTVGVAFADLSSKEVGLTEFLDNELFSNLESLLIQLGAKECLVSDNKTQLRIHETIDRCGVTLTTVKSADFPTSVSALDGALSDLSKLVGKEPILLSVEGNKSVAMGSFAALIKYLNIGGEKNFTLKTHDLSQYMRLDASALKALNLFSGIDGPKTGSLCGLLDRCKSQVGSRMLKQWIKQPLMNQKLIEQRHLLVESFVERPDIRQGIQELMVVPDLTRIAKKFTIGKANLEDVVKVYQVVIKLSRFISLLEEVEEKYLEAVEYEFLHIMKELKGDLRKYEELVETTVDLEALDRHEFIIKADFQEDLQQLAAQLEELRASIEDEHAETARVLGMEGKLKLEQHHVFGWCFRLTRTDAGCLRRFSGFFELSTQKAGVYFESAKLRKIKSNFVDADEAYKRAQRSLVHEVVEVAGSFNTLFETLAIVLGKLDIIVSFADISSIRNYVRPKMHPRNARQSMILKQARHPCLEVQEDVTFIPNDVHFERGSREFMVITGPNMGGKSTYIRQIGVIVLMAQIGCFVPCEEAEMCIFDAVLARVGAGDSQSKGVSTFMAEMLETAAILQSATEESLIVIDELGRGTSTYDGFGLAWAISDHILGNIGCYTMFATHFHELTDLKKTHPGVANMHVAAHVGNDRKDITLLYKVVDGVSNESFGLHVAEVVGFPSKVVNMAKHKAAELEGHDESRVNASQLIKSILKRWVSETDLDDKDSLNKLRKIAQEENILENTHVKAVMG